MRRPEPRTAPESIESSTRFWLRAYPRRWRAAFGEDLVGVQAEVSEPDARHVPAREALAIVQAGWALRLREHPPLLRWLGYRFLDRRLPLQHQHWVADDILGRFWFTRTMTASAFLAMLSLLTIYAFVPVVDPQGAIATAARVFGGMICLSMLLNGAGSTPRRRKTWQRHISPEVPWRLLSARDRARTPRAGRDSDTSPVD